jgi:hypothetical protein
MKYCHQCGTGWEGVTQPGIRETCTHCGEDLHVCLNCRLYDQKKSQHCQVETDPVRDVARANFCEEFLFADRPARPAAAAPGTATARARWDTLFKKKDPS